jgi:hypothetical protein
VLALDLGHPGEIADVAPLGRDDIDLAVNGRM